MKAIHVGSPLERGRRLQNRFEPPGSIVTCQGRRIITYTSAAFIPRQLARRQTPMVVSMLIALLCALVLTLVCLVMMHPVNGGTNSPATAQSGESLGSLIEEYDP